MYIDRMFFFINICVYADCPDSHWGCNRRHAKEDDGTFTSDAAGATWSQDSSDGSSGLYR